MSSSPRPPHPGREIAAGHALHSSLVCCALLALIGCSDGERPAQGGRDAGRAGHDGGQDGGRADQDGRADSDAGGADHDASRADHDAGRDGDSGPPSLPPPVIEEGPCAVPPPAGLTASDLRCGTLLVAESREHPTDRRVRLPFVVIKARGPSPAPDPYVFLPGGPGGDGLSAVGGVLLPDRALVVERRDVVLFDVRGTGLATPSLACPEIDDAQMALYASPYGIGSEAKGLEDAARACHDRLVAEKIDLTAYSSKSVAADLHDLMTALGYESFNIRGVSYGTRYALTVLRDDPRGVRSVILDSTVPLQSDLAVQQPTAVQHAIDTLVAGCAKDAACNSAFPDLGATLAATARALDASPATLSPVSPATGKPFPLVLTGARLIQLLWLSQFGTALIPTLPRLIQSASAGDYAPVETAARLLAGGALSLGDYYSVVCAEETPFDTQTAYDAAMQSVRPEIANAIGSVFRTEATVCKLWGAGTPASAENEPVTSDVPVLVLEGEYDPVTPPSEGDEAARTLTKSTTVLVPAVGHGVMYAPTGETTRPRCALSIALAFLDDPTKPIDESCLATVPPPAFVVP